MAKTKVTKCRQLPKWLLHRGRQQCMGQTYPYKIKLALPKQKQVDIKKNGHVVKTINVRRRSK